MPGLVENYDLFTPQQSPLVQDLASTTAAIALHYFEWRYITLLFFNSTLLEGINRFLKIYDKSVVTSRGLTKPRFPEETRQYVIYGENIQDITRMLNWMESHIFDNTGKYIVICESQDCDEVEAVKTFWYHKITNVVFLKYSRYDIVGYYYFFSKDNCAMSAPVKIDLKFCLGNMSRCVLYPEKFANLYKCPLVTSTFQQMPYMNLKGEKPGGSDGALLLILTEALNATLQIMTPHRGDGWGALDPKNGTWLGSLSDIYYDLANISMTSAALTLSRFSDFQQSYYYNFVKVGWITSPTELESSSLKLVHPFHRHTHIAVLTTFFIVIFCSLFLNSRIYGAFKKRLGIGSGQKNNVVFLSWMICMGLPTAKLPKKPVLLYLAFLWIWYTFMVRTFYQASLINSLKSNVYVTNVDTIEDILKSKRKFGGGLALQDYYINYPEVYDNFIGMNATELLKLAAKISRGEKFAVAVNVEAVASFYANQGGSFHILPQPIVVSPTAIFFKKFSPLARSVTKNLRRLVEAGISDKLYRNYVQTQTKAARRSDNNEPMTLAHYTGCYAILLIGWTLSCLIFVCELIINIKNTIVFNSLISLK